MARDIDRRLNSLNSRRRGTDRLDAVAMDAAVDMLSKSMASESYATRAPTQKTTKYALGAMQAVDADYTRISHEEAERVGAQLKAGLDRKSIPVHFRLQGSVAADIHIRGVSDVDLLVLDGRYFRYDPSGYRAMGGGYGVYPYDDFQALRQLRKDSEEILKSAYPAAKVDTTGAKAVKLSGGSLRRPVDVVPANWYDTSDYQQTWAEVDRGVEILDTSVPARVLNMPFRHIQRLGERDAACIGGLKKAIRLCKNVKADALEDGTKIDLPSFDIASVLWHADVGALRVGVANELAILAEATRFLDFLARNLQHAVTLLVPDGSRPALNTAAKQAALINLSLEMDDLALSVAREQANLSESVQVNPAQVTEVLKRALVPG